MTIKEQIQIINNNRGKLTSGQRLQFSGIKSMFRNIKEEGFTGGESGVSRNGVKNAVRFLDKHVAAFV